MGTAGGVEGGEGKERVRKGERERINNQSMNVQCHVERYILSLCVN